MEVQNISHVQFTAYNEKLIINSNIRYIWVLTPCFQNNEGEGDRGLATKQRGEGNRERGTAPGDMTGQLPRANLALVAKLGLMFL